MDIKVGGELEFTINLAFQTAFDKNYNDGGSITDQL